MATPEDHEQGEGPDPLGPLRNALPEPGDADLIEHQPGDDPPEELPQPPPTWWA